MGYEPTSLDSLNFNQPTSKSNLLGNKFDEIFLAQVVHTKELVVRRIVSTSKRITTECRPSQNLHDDRHAIVASGDAVQGILQYLARAHRGQIPLPLWPQLLHNLQDAILRQDDLGREDDLVRGRLGILQDARHGAPDLWQRRNAHPVVAAVEQLGLVVRKVQESRRAEDELEEATAGEDGPRQLALGCTLRELFLDLKHGAVQGEVLDLGAGGACSVLGRDEALHARGDGGVDEEAL